MSPLFDYLEKSPATGIGNLDKRIRILRKTSTPDGRGGEKDVQWNVDVTWWAEAIQLSGQELWFAHQVHANTKFVFRVRYSASWEIGEEMRVRYREKDYAIENVENWKERDEWLLLWCSGPVST